jgi:hypothetical protein
MVGLLQNNIIDSCIIIFLSSVVDCLLLLICVTLIEHFVHLFATPEGRSGAVIALGLREKEAHPERPISGGTSPG